MEKNGDVSRGILFKSNVVGFGTGIKVKNGKTTRKKALLVLVTRKVPLEALSVEDVIPAEIDGQPTDVVEVGEIRALDEALPLAAEPDRLSRVRPLTPGTSIGHYKVTAGTFGAVVYDRKTRKPLLLSNNHVFANSSGPDNQNAVIGDPILQPGPYDGGTMVDMIANLRRFIPLKTLRTRDVGRDPIIQPADVNTADAAVAEPAAAVGILEAPLGLQTPMGITVPKTGLNVSKSGRTTGVTKGRIKALNCTLKVSYGGDRIGVFSGQIMCTCKSQGGDSGSLIVDSKNRAVGLLFAGSETYTVASPISTVLSGLDATLG